MKATFQNELFAVFDDFLSRDALDQVWNGFREEPMQYVKSRAAVRVFRPLDGEPLAGKPIFNAPRSSGGDVPLYPSGRPIDAVVEAIEGAAGTFEPWVGRKGTDWTCFSATPFMYPMGSGLSWHRDSRDRTGSFVAYVHPEWRDSWGAELLVESAAAEGGSAANAGWGQYVTPMPNRLVVISSQARHAIKKVDLQAGENCRASIAGFFQK
ncbi:hypothetical protein DN069_20815 [Streptacidiphilus pinicola]|uniref:Fe2OG dioxygenase domain-containing protein n=1 Tax=Streptacidiphilus pinicola TaxID=2219663 RepID=A0A2X0J880_9ACTN|nr:2OG-Fe(II) oxygenase [Streptacidiphilus pinicola]RAG83698.1 hypothetical protein DN069_20815 [Streptacidiphilus pinicola]